MRQRPAAMRPAPEPRTWCGRTIMRITAAFIVIGGLAAGGPAHAQSTDPSFSSKSTGQTTGAPVGHRQPRPGDVPPPPPDRATTDMAPTGSVASPRPDPNDPEERLNR